MISRKLPSSAVPVPEVFPDHPPSTSTDEPPSCAVLPLPFPTSALYAENAISSFFRPWISSPDADNRIVSSGGTSVTQASEALGTSGCISAAQTRSSEAFVASPDLQAPGISPVKMTLSKLSVSDKDSVPDPEDTIIVSSDDEASSDNVYSDDPCSFNFNRPVWRPSDDFQIQPSFESAGWESNSEGLVKHYWELDKVAEVDDRYMDLGSQRIGLHRQSEVFEGQPDEPDGQLVDLDQSKEFDVQPEELEDQLEDFEDHAGEFEAFREEFHHETEEFEDQLEDLVEDQREELDDKYDEAGDQHHRLPFYVRFRDSQSGKFFLLLLSVDLQTKVFLLLQRIGLLLTYLLNYLLLTTTTYPRRVYLFFSVLRVADPDPQLNCFIKHITYLLCLIKYFRQRSDSELGRPKWSPKKRGN